MTRWWVLCVLASLAANAAAERRTTEAITLRKKPGEKEIAVASVPANTEVTVLATEGRWLRVRVGANEGYVPHTQVTDDTPPPAASNTWSTNAGRDVLGKRAETVTSSAGVVAEYTRAAPSRLSLRTELGIGYRTLGMDLTSNAEGGLTNYLVDADAMATAFGTTGTLRLARGFVGFDARAELSSSSPGIDYPGPTATPGKIPFTTFAADAGARLGLRAGDIELAARAGGHYDAFLPKSVDNAGMLPRERLLGLVVGARAEIEPSHSRFGATARFDILALGSRAQTPGLEDGKSSTAHALWGGVTVRYSVGRWVPFAAYDFGRATTSWTGPSVREPSVTNAHRTDTTQLLQIGIGAEL